MIRRTEAESGALWLEVETGDPYAKVMLVMKREAGWATLESRS